MGIAAEDIMKFLDHINQFPGEWPVFEAKILYRCETSFGQITQMGIVDDVRNDLNGPRRGSFKVNNNWAPYYMRLFALKYPEYSARFEFRMQQKREDKEAA